MDHRDDKILNGKKGGIKQVKVKNNYNCYYLLAGIVVLTLIIFSNSVHNDFINYDDNVYITGNNYIKNFSAEGFSDIIRSYSKDELPVTLLSFTIDYKFFGLNPLPYHIENIIWHILNVLLVFLLVRKITKRDAAALITSLLFAVHPLRTESVVWSAERKDMLVTFFFLASVIAYINYLTHNLRARSLVFSLILSILAVLAKFTALTLPFVLLLLDYYYSRKFNFRTVLEKIPFVIVPLISGLIHYSTPESHLLVGQYTQSFSQVDSIFIAGYSLFFYLSKLLFPFYLSAIHPCPPKINGFLPLYYYFNFFLAFLVIFAIVLWIYKARKIRKDLIFGFSFFFLTISLVLHLVPFGGWAIVSERYTYLPYLGLFFLVGQAYYLQTYFLIKNAKRFQKVFLSVLFLYTFLFCIITYSRNEVWKNSITLFSDVIEKDSTVYIAYMNRGFAKYCIDDDAGALQDFNKTISLNPKFVEAYNIRGALLNKVHNYQDAIHDFDKAIALNNKFTAAYNNRGNSRLSLKDYYGSIYDYTKAIEAEPDYALAYNNRGCVKCYNLNEFAGAIDDFNKAILFDKYYGEAYFNRSYCYMVLKNNLQTCSDLKMAYKLGYEKAGSLIKTYCEQ